MDFFLTSSRERTAILLNVLYLINFAGKAGTEKYVENLVRILGRDRITPYFAYNIDGELSRKMRDAGVPTLQLDMGKKAALFSAPKKLAAYCRENHIDVIHAQYPRENLIALRSKKYYDVPRVVMTSHLTLRLSGFSGLIWKQINKKYSPRNHCVIPVCREGRDILIENGVLPERIRVIYNGIEPAPLPVKTDVLKKELSLADNCFVFFIMARFAPEKGLSFLVDSLAALKHKTDRPFCCAIAGDGELTDEIAAQIAAQGLQNECRLLGYRTDTKDLLPGADAYLCSSLCNEAMSFAILEAMRAGLPLVVTDVGGNRDLAETDMQCGFVVDYGDTDAFSDKMKLLMDEPAQRDALAKAANDKVAKYFDLEKLAGDVCAAYN